MLTTTEVLCRHIHGALQTALRHGDLGDGAEAVTAIRVTLGETLQARAWSRSARSLHRPRSHALPTSRHFRCQPRILFLLWFPCSGSINVTEYATMTNTRQPA